MKLSLSTLTCPEWPLDRIFSTAAACGIGGVDFRGVGEEIDVTRLTAFTTDLPQTLAALRTHGLEMPCLNTSVTLVSPDGARWQAMLDECHRYAKLAGASGAPFLRVFGGGVPKDLGRGEALGMARRHIRQLVKVCRPQHCRPLVETHDDWSTSPQILDLLADVDPLDAGVLWDVEHPFRRGEPPAETARLLKPYLLHAHVKDSTRVDGRSVPTLLGEGDLPLAEFAQALRDVGYDGWVCLETEKRWHAEAPDPERSVPQFAAFMREMAASIAVAGNA